MNEQIKSEGMACQNKREEIRDDIRNREKKTNPKTIQADKRKEKLTKRTKRLRSVFCFFFK